MEPKKQKQPDNNKTGIMKAAWIALMIVSGTCLSQASFYVTCVAEEVVVGGVTAALAVHKYTDGETLLWGIVIITGLAILTEIIYLWATTDDHLPEPEQERDERQS